MPLPLQFNTAGGPQAKRPEKEMKGIPIRKKKKKKIKTISTHNVTMKNKKLQKSNKNI